MPAHLSVLTFCGAIAVSVISPAFASASTSPTHKAERSAPLAKTHPCEKPAVEVVAGAESARVSLARCTGEVATAAVDELSVLARPSGVAKPAAMVAGHGHGAELAPGIRRLDAHLVDRLERVAEHFAREGQTARVTLVSGVRPRGSGSLHASGRALDLRLEGVSNKDLVAFCKTLPDTGCGLYPNDVFVHMDVRDPGTGHVSWVDEGQRSSTAVPPEGAEREPTGHGVSVVRAAESTPGEGGDGSAALGLSLARPSEQDSPATQPTETRLPTLPAPAERSATLTVDRDEKPHAKKGKKHRRAARNAARHGAPST